MSTCSANKSRCRQTPGRSSITSRGTRRAPFLTARPASGSGMAQDVRRWDTRRERRRRRRKAGMSTKVALVTGAAAGIGAAISRRLARDGIAIGVLDVSIDDAVKVADEISSGGGRAIALHADITARKHVEAALGKLRGAFGPVTILVNNAGITGFVPFEELTE